jgi:3',5'-cyclic AMP phosphodiesterase CpdA
LKKTTKISYLLALLLSVLLVCSCAAEPKSAVPVVSASPQPTPATPIAGADRQQSAVLIESGTTQWRYFDGGEDPAPGMARTVWTEPGFDDRAWAVASGSFGVKDGELAALSDGYTPQNLLHHDLDSDKVVPAYFFRTEFTIIDPTQAPELAGEIAFDDAVIVYLNGQPVYSDNLPGLAYEINQEYGAEDAFGAPLHKEFSIYDTSMLKAGQNVLAVEVHQADSTSSDAYFDFISLVIREESGDGTTENDLSPFLTDETEDISLRRFALQIGADPSAVTACLISSEMFDVTLMLTTDEITTGEYPEDSTEYPMERARISNTGLYAYTAQIEGLIPGLTYQYYLTDGTERSDAVSFTPAPAADGFSFVFAGDPQFIEAYRAKNLEQFSAALDTAARHAANPAFILSAGDQVNSSNSYLSYNAFLSTQAFQYTPLAVNRGNHDSNAELFDAYFHMPNQTTQWDYFFTYGDALFLSINSNDDDYEAHRQFIRETIAAQPSRWVFVTMHHPLYSVGDHADSDLTQELRAAFAGFFTEMNIDVVLCGHDHTYTRTHLMANDAPVKTGDAETEVTKRPGQTLYIAANSSTGSKLYDLADVGSYAAAYNQDETPDIATVKISRESVIITTYNVTDDTVADQIILKK